MASKLFFNSIYNKIKDKVNTGVANYNKQQGSTTPTNTPKTPQASGNGNVYNQQQSIAKSVTQTAPKSPYSEKTNYQNEYKYLSGLASKGNSWAVNQMKELNKWHASQSKNDWSTLQKADKPVFSQADPGSITSNPNNAMYNTSQQNKDMYGTNSSTHIVKPGASLDPNRGDVDDKGLYVSNIYGRDESGLWKQNDDGTRWYMNDKNKQDFASHIQLADGTWIQTGGTGNFGYDEKNKTTFNFTDSSYRKATDSMYDMYSTEGSRNEDRQQKLAEWENTLKSMSPEELAKLKAETNSQALKNHISALDGTALNDKRYNGLAPVGFAPEGQQFNLQNLVYDYMRQNGGVESFDGKDTLSANQAINKSGLGGLFNINQVTEPLITELMAKAQAEAEGGTAEMQIDTKAIMDELVKNGALKEGYIYDDKTGNISVDPRYVQVGDILMDKQTYFNNYGDDKGYWADMLKHENNAGQMTETPLEYRARTAPQSLTPEMKQDLEVEREIKSQLEQLKLDLSFLEQLEAGDGVPMVLGSGIGAGVGGIGDGMGATNANQSLTGAYGSGGGSDFLWQQGSGKGAVYGTSQNTTNVNQQLLNAMYKRVGGK